MKAVFFETAPWERRFLKRVLAPHRLSVTFVPDPLTDDTLRQAASAEILSVFIYSHLTARLLRRLPRLRFIATRSTGFDHIDLAACRTRQIMVSNVPSYGENTVAEHTFALILALSRNIHKAYVKTIKGDFSLTGLQGFDLKGKTLGVVGAGHIGLHVIKMAKGFGMDVLVYDVQKSPFLSEVLDFRYVPLDTLLSSSDIVSLHVPYLPSTHHLMNRERFKRMKRGALFINTARGGLVDTGALVWALDEGIVSGAGLDVLEGEELVKEERQLLSTDFPKEKLATALRNHILLHRENVVITPHIAFDSKEALQRILETTVANIVGFLGGSPVNAVPGILKSR
ncbi:MAG: hydroxyacid dehydrogenase [Candidatus Omnitrophica bacterium CG11_big_fil_rev_8_21_14_0_20_63_9]|nr:MAG: hydroxyacid dehydrogenase [Candidatus Omnitrophica bacterium CG11_big_fil_rev_8_21_14_0_20_63_9]